MGLTCLSKHLCEAEGTSLHSGSEGILHIYMLYFIHLADAFVQSNIQIVHIESIAEHQGSEVHNPTVFWWSVKEQYVIYVQVQLTWI